MKSSFNSPGLAEARLPEPRPFSTARPAGIDWAGFTWVGCGFAGLAINLLLVAVVLWAKNPVLAQTGFAPETGLALLAIGPVTIAFYAVLIGMGLRCLRGRQHDVQVPAGIGLILAYTTLTWNTLEGVTALHEFIDNLEEFRSTSTNPAPLVYMGASMVAALVLALLDVALIASCVVLLWQSGPYLRWVQGGGWAPGPRSGGVPLSIVIASATWTLTGILAAVLVFTAYCTTRGRAWDEIGISGGERAFVNAVYLGGLVAAPLLTLFLAGLLLLHGRLPSATQVGCAVLLLTLGALLVEIGLVFEEVDPFTWVIPQGPLMALLPVTGLACLAAIECTRGRDAYKEWVSGEPARRA
jgi:hypothetical protein